MGDKPEAWLVEFRFEGRDDWSVYGVFRRTADADSLMRTAVMGLEGRVVPLYRHNPRIQRPGTGPLE